MATSRLSVPQLKLSLLYVLVGVRRTVRRAAWDVLGLLGRRQAQHECLLLDGKHNPPLADLHSNIADAKSRDLFSPPPFVVRFGKPVVVEPRYGWAISSPARLEDLSMTRGWKTHTWKGREWLGLPSPLGFIARGVIRRPQRNIPQAVSLISPWPENYFHFISDVLPKLLAFEDAGVPADLPILVSGELADMPFFRDACRRGDLRNRQFIPAGPEPLRVHELYVAQGPRLDASVAARLHAMLGQRPRHAALTERIFVTRAAHRGRTIANFDEVEPIITAAGYRIVDLDEESFDNQVEIFSSAERIAGIHGAGLVNMVFAGCPVFEIIPHGFDDDFDTFRQLSSRLGLPYRRFHGEPGVFLHKRDSFRVDPAQLHDALERFERECEAIVIASPA